MAKAPFVDLRRTADGPIDAEVRVLALDCTVLATFTVNANDYALRIDEAGSATLDSYWIGQRPTTHDTLEPTTECVVS